MSLLDYRRVTHVAVSERKPHTHPEGQMFSVRTGLVTIEVGDGRWVMPPGCIGWVPPHQLHGADIHGPMQGLSLYFDECWSRSQMPATVKVVRMTPLLRAISDTLDDPTRKMPEVQNAYLAVFADEFCRQPAQTLFLPMPRDARLLLLATALLAEPDDNTDLDGWAERIGMARRTLTRRFQLETGLSLAQWRQQMRLTLALERLAAGRSVTTVALEMGYASVSSFIAVFRRYLGATPTAYFGSASV